MNNFLSKFILSLKKPKIIVVTGSSRQVAAEAIFQVLKPHFKVKKISGAALPLDLQISEILIFEAEDIDIKKFEPFLKNSQPGVLVITQVGDIPLDFDVFAGEKEKVKEAEKLAKSLPSQDYLVLNYDDETVREMDDFTNLQTLTFGFDNNAQFYASDLKLNGGTNFKVNHKGNSVPVWLNRLFGKEQVYAALVGTAIGTIFNLNLVDISQALKNYYSLQGQMRIIEGINNSRILDDSESATIFSMAEAIELLGKIPEAKRRIAVLGDVIGAGQYTIEAHEALGERVAKNADLLFVFGQRAQFIAEGAQQKGMLPEKIFRFDMASIERGKAELRNEIKEGDLILIDGSSEMEMEKVVDEIKI